MSSIHDAGFRERGAFPPDRTEIVRRVAEKIVGMGLAAPAIRFLESGSSRPSAPGRTSFHFGPLASLLTFRDEDRQVVEFLDDGATVESLIEEIERIEEENREPGSLARRRNSMNRRFGRIVRRRRFDGPGGETAEKPKGAPRRQGP